jgi:hypothetical protein
VAASFGGPKWGIFRNGKPPVVGTSISGFEYKSGSRVADHPIEEGGFDSYNKVQEPYDARITIICDGSTPSSRQSAISATTATANRAAFLATVDGLVKSLELVSIATPEFTYTNANCVQYSYARKSRDGISWIVCDIALKEIRQVPANGFAAAPAPQQPEGASPVNNGSPQTTTPTAAQTPPVLSDGLPTIPANVA